MAYGRGLLAVSRGLRPGGAVAELERALAPDGYHAVMVPMARAGIYLLLKYSIRSGQKVILSPYTIADVVNMVLCAGGVPLFADVEAGGTCNVSATEVRRLLDAENNVGAVLITHFYGLICDAEPIRAACRARGIFLLEDAAQAFGATGAGALADAGVLSFGLFKTVTSFYGGAVLVRDSALAERVRAEVESWPRMPRAFFLRRMLTAAGLDLATAPLIFGSLVFWLFRFASLRGKKFFSNQLAIDRDPRAYRVFPRKYAVRFSRQQARMVLAALPELKERLHERIRKARLYHEGLRDLPGIMVPPLRLDGTHAYPCFAVLCDQRDELARYLTRMGRDVQVSHHRNCAELACFREFHRDCPEAARAARGILYLPLYHGYGEDEVRVNVRVIQAFVRGHA